MHVERFGKDQVLNIEIGECFIFPKLDGTNASVWLHDGKIEAGSRNRKLSLEFDNAGFLKWVLQQENVFNYLKENPTHRLFGEWLVPHSLKTYHPDAWNQFYVFDVALDEDGEQNDPLNARCSEEDASSLDGQLKYLHFNFYKPLLEKHNISFVPKIAVLKNVDYQELVDQLEKNDFLVEKGIGEGIVIKNYDFKNKSGRTVWAKMISSEFEENKLPTRILGIIEKEIALKYVTLAFCEKELSKMKNEAGGCWTSKMIPHLLSQIWSEMIREESWNIVRENGNPTINFSRLRYFVYAEIREKLPDVFGGR